MPLGYGAYGMVELQKCVQSTGYINIVYRAVKIINTSTGGGIDWIRELETIIEFSHHTVSEKIYTHRKKGSAISFF